MVDVSIIRSGTDLLLTSFTTHLLVVIHVLVVGATVFKKAIGFVVSNRIGMILSGNVLQINTHRLTESDFRFDITLLRWQP